MRKKIFYGWFIVIACMFLNAIGTGIFASIMGLFFPFIVEALGASQTAVAGIISIAILAGLLTLGIFSKLYEKYSTRLLILIFGILNGFAYIAMAKASSLTLMYFFAAFIGIFGMGATALSAPMLITRWFNEKRATAMGIAVAGSGLGPAILAPIITRILGNQGYEQGFIALGLIIVCSMLFCFILIRNHPEDIGLEPYGGNSPQMVSDENTTQQNSYNYTVKEAVKTKMFLGFILFIVINTMIVQGVLLQLPSYFASTGLSPTHIGSIIGAYAFVASFGRILNGVAYDKFGIFKANVIFFTLIIISIISLISAETFPVAIYIFVIPAGLGIGVTPIIVPLLVSQLFGSKHYSSLYAIFMLTMSFGAIIGGVIGGLIIDLFGYQVLLSYSLFGFIVAFLFIQWTLVTAKKTHRSRIGAPVNC